MLVCCHDECLLAFGGAAHRADATYPDRPITLDITAAPGGVTDVTGRALARSCPRPGASRSSSRTKAAPRILSARKRSRRPRPTATRCWSASPELSPSTRRSPNDKVPYDTDKDFMPITGLVRIYQALLADRALPVSNAAELIALAKRSRAS